MRGVLIEVTIRRIAIGVGLFVATFAQASSKVYVRTQIMMGTVPVSVSVVGHPYTEAVEKAFAEGARLEGILSGFKDSSDVSRLNREASKGFVSVRPETFEVIRRSLEMSRLTQGAFDITYASPRGSFRDLVLNPQTLSVRYKRRGLIIDVHGLAKGTIVDRMIEILRRDGVRNAMVNAGGDLRVMGKGPEGPWRVEIQDPDGRLGRSIRRLSVESGGMATSGFYARGDHIVDPRTRQPVASPRVKSATVFAPDAMTADALATAVCVLGSKKGQRLLDSLKDVGVSGFIIP